MSGMKLLWSSDAWEDCLYWQRTDQKVMSSINELIKDIGRDPFKGLGKPEPLKHELKGWWSRRITKVDRLVYRVTGRSETYQLEILQCRYHYE
jgi:toxin YoeB